MPCEQVPRTLVWQGMVWYFIYMQGTEPYKVWIWQTW